MSKSPSHPLSDRPPALNKERDEFVQTFFSKGAQFTQELLREIEVLNQYIADLEFENASMRLQIKSDQAIRELLVKIEKLEGEKATLASEVREVETKSSAIESTCSEVETEFAHLASLYVASRNLHSTMNVSSSIRQVREVLEQLVGAKSYGLYFLSNDGTQLVRVASRGIDDAVMKTAKLHEGVLGKVVASGIADIAEDGDLSQCTLTSPAACIPMHLDGRVIGAIAIFSTLEQKTRFLPVDYEFFKLLSGHAASAIISARLFVDANRQVPGIETLLEHGV